MNRIYLSGNYIIVEEDGLIKPFSKGKSEYNEAIDHFSLRKFPNKENIIFKFTDLVNWTDDQGTTYTKTTLRAFLRENTDEGAEGTGSGATLDDVVDAINATNENVTDNTNPVLSDIRDSNSIQESLIVASNNLLTNTRDELIDLNAKELISNTELIDSNQKLDQIGLSLSNIEVSDTSFYADLLSAQGSIQTLLGGINTSITGTNTELTTLLTRVQVLVDQTDQIEALLTNIDINLVANRTANTNALEQLRVILVALDANTDEVESSLTSIIGEVDEVEEKLDEIKALLTSVDETQAIITGTNNNIPAGFKTVLINSLGGTNTLNFGGGNTFQLGAGRRADGITLEANNLNTKNGLLPAITISGGTWQWIVLATLTS